MITAKTSFTISALLIVGMLVFDANPAVADPTGTTFSFVTDNFQGDGGDPAVPFGTPTSIPGSGVTVDSTVMISPAIPELFLVGGLEFLEFSITTDDGGFLNGTSGDQSAWLIDGLTWGDGRPGFATGLIFLSFDIDGTFVDLTGTSEIPIVPHPFGGHDAVPVDIAGDPVSTIPFDTASLTGVPLLTSLLGLGVSFSDALSVNSMHVGFEVTHIPEPTSLALVGLGCAALTIGRRRRR